MSDDKIITGLEIIVEGNEVSVKSNLEDCEGSLKLFIAFLTLIKNDPHATKHFIQAMKMVEKNVAVMVDIDNKTKEVKKTLVN